MAGASGGENRHGVSRQGGDGTTTAREVCPPSGERIGMDRRSNDNGAPAMGGMADMPPIGITS